MANFDLIMPKMGESVAEATIIKWTKKEGDMLIATFVCIVSSEINDPLIACVQNGPCVYVIATRFENCCDASHVI